jgi:nucleoside-diphosphate-sugar epimerase
MATLPQILADIRQTMLLEHNTDRSILIIGGCGYIGSALFRFLEKKHCYHIDTVDTEWFGNHINPRNYAIDIANITESFLSRYAVIILLAGHSSVSMCYNDPLGAFNNNVTHFIELLSKLTPSQRFIYASSSSVYSGASTEIYTEDSFKSYYPLNTYDLSKWEIDLYAQLGKLSYYGLRFGTVCGASPNLRIDLMINAMYHTAKTDRIINLYHPEIHRPILGMTDLCRAVESIILAPEDKSGIYNLASFNTTAHNIAQSVSKHTKTKIHRKTPPSEIQPYSFSISSEKFCTTFAFSFQDTVQTIIQDLDIHYTSTQNKAIRDRKP